MASIPLDLVREVLASFPVKDLLRFRCVSKLFRSLIDSPDFRKLHLSLSRKTQIHVYGIESLVQFEHPQFKVFDVTNSVNDVSVVMVNRSPGFKPKPLWVFAGSCNGLIALRQSGARGVIMFWNPLTGKSKSVASFIPHNFPITYGFGYDPKTDDYKLVRIVVLYNENRPNQVTLRTAVYSLKMDSWKQIGNVLSVYGRFGFWHDQPGVLANNALHWINRDEIDDRKIVAFDLINEKFYYVSVLGGFQYEYYIRKLSVLDGCLALTFRYGKHNNVWVMKEYGVKESWTKVLSYLRSALGYSDNIYPLVYSSSRDKFLLSCSSSWYWFDLISGKYDRCPNINGYLRTMPLKLFSGSLIAPDDSTHVVDLKRKQTVLENNNENEEEKRRKTKQVESL